MYERVRGIWIRDPSHARPPTLALLKILMKNAEILMAFLFRRHNRISLITCSKLQTNILPNYKHRPKLVDIPTQQSCPSLGNALIVLFISVPPFTTHIRLGQWKSFKIFKIKLPTAAVFQDKTMSSMNRDLRIASTLGKRSKRFMKTFAMIKLKALFAYKYAIWNGSFYVFEKISFIGPLSLRASSEYLF